MPCVRKPIRDNRDDPPPWIGGSASAEIPETTLIFPDRVKRCKWERPVWLALAVIMVFHSLIQNWPRTASVAVCRLAQVDHVIFSRRDGSTNTKHKLKALPLWLHVVLRNCVSFPVLVATSPNVVTAYVADKIARVLSIGPPRFQN